MVLPVEFVTVCRSTRTVEVQDLQEYKMCLNELDLSVFLSDQTPVPHDVIFLVEDDFDKTNNTTLMAHR